MTVVTSPESVTDAPTLADLAKLSAAATPGPWVNGTPHTYHDGSVNEDVSIVSATHRTYAGYRPDAEGWPTEVIYGVWCNDSTADLGIEPADRAFLLAAVNYVRSLLEATP